MTKHDEAVEPEPAFAAAEEFVHVVSTTISATARREARMRLIAALSTARREAVEARVAYVVMIGDRPDRVFDNAPDAEYRAFCLEKDGARVALSCFAMRHETASFSTARGEEGGRDALIFEARRLLRRYSTSEAGWRKLARQMLDYLGEAYEFPPKDDEALPPVPGEHAALIAEARDQALIESHELGGEHYFVKLLNHLADALEGKPHDQTR
jgi:hypothetical protein